MEDTFEKADTAYQCEKERKRDTHTKKLEKLGETTRRSTRYYEVQEIPGLVVNKSAVTFNEKEMRLLNMGLNYAVKPSKIPREDIIVRGEAAMSKLPEVHKNSTRESIATAITGGVKSAHSPEEITVMGLKNKPVYFIQADKGNTVDIWTKLNTKKL